MSMNDPEALIRCASCGTLSTSEFCSTRCELDQNREENASYSDQKHERREITADDTARRERAQAPRLDYPGADQMMRWQRDYK